MPKNTPISLVVDITRPDKPTAVACDLAVALNRALVSLRGTSAAKLSPSATCALRTHDGQTTAHLTVYVAEGAEPSCDSDELADKLALKMALDSLPALRAARRACSGSVTALEGCCLSMDLDALLFDEDGNPLTGWQVGQVMGDIAELARMLAGGNTVVMAGVSDSGAFVDLTRVPSGGFRERTGAELMGELIDRAARHPSGTVAGWLKTLREEAEEDAGAEEEEEDE